MFDKKKLCDSLKAMLIAANWKMKMGYQKALSFLSEFTSLIQKEEAGHFIFFPPAGLCLLFQSKSLYWGPQNIYQQKEGAFTGENSVTLFKEMGASFCLLGHSERRNIFGETDIEIEKKFSLLQESALIPVMCIGESMSDRFQKEKSLLKKLSWIKQYTKYDNLPFHPHLLPSSFQNFSFIVAYEPLWSIGTGDTPSSSEIEEVVELIKNDLPHVKVFYGGSVEEGNISSLMSNNLDGFLVGGASLNPQSLYQIYKQTQT